MKLITHKSKNLLYRILPASNCTVQFCTSYVVATQTSADTSTNIRYKCQYRKDNVYLRDVFDNVVITSTGKITRTFTTPADLDYNRIMFGINGTIIDTLVAVRIKLKPSTTYTLTCNFTNITQGSISWKDMMLVEGSTAGDYEPYSYNLLDKYGYSATTTKDGITFTNNGNGSWTVNGTATQKTSINFFNSPTKLSKGDKICLSSPIDIEAYGKFWYEINVIYVDGSYRYFSDVRRGVFSLANDVSMIYSYIAIGAGETVSGATIKPQLYDLTLMYGSGKEPTTVDQFYADYPMLKVAPLGFIDIPGLELKDKGIKRLRYKTWDNNLNELAAVGFRSGGTENGINFINNGDGSWTIRGTKTSGAVSSTWGILAGTYDFPVSNGDKILFTKMADDALGSKYSMYTSIRNSSHIWIANFGAEITNKDVIYTVSNSSAAYASISFTIRSSDYVDITVAPQAYNLTKIYGAGNEPATVDQFYKDYPLAKTSPLGFVDLGILPCSGGT